MMENKKIKFESDNRPITKGLKNNVTLFNFLFFIFYFSL